MTKGTLTHLLTHSMMTPAERAKGRFMRAPDGHGDGGKFTQEQLDAAIEKAIGPLKESIGNLEGKRDELIAENRKLKRGAEIKPEDLTAAEERADKAEAALADATKQVKALTGERDKAVKALEGEQSFTQRLLIQDGLKSALIANGVKDEDFLDTLTAKFAGGASIVTEGDQRKAMLGDKPMADAIKEWAGSDAGKKFVSAPDNSGGGAQGGKADAAPAKTMLRSEFDALAPAQQHAFTVKEGGKVVDAAA
jgi:hypothetical protein